MTCPHRIPAAPFRAHLLHECAAAKVPWSVAAVYAGLPIMLTHQLLDCRPGRRVEGVSPELGRRVLSITAESLSALAWTMRPAQRSRYALGHLLSRGCSLPTLARRLQLSESALRALAGGQVPQVPALVELRLAVLVTLAAAASAKSRLAA